MIVDALKLYHLTRNSSGESVKQIVEERCVENSPRRGVFVQSRRDGIRPGRIVSRGLVAELNDV